VFQKFQWSSDAVSTLADITVSDAHLEHYCDPLCSWFGKDRRKIVTFKAGI